MSAVKAVHTEQVRNCYERLSTLKAQAKGKRNSDLAHRSTNFKVSTNMEVLKNLELSGNLDMSEKASDCRGTFAKPG